MGARRRAYAKRFRIGYLGQPMHRSFERAAQRDSALEAERIALKEAAKTP